MYVASLILAQQLLIKVQRDLALRTAVLVHAPAFTRRGAREALDPLAEDGAVLEFGTGVPASPREHYHAILVDLSIS